MQPDKAVVSIVSGRGNARACGLACLFLAALKRQGMQAAIYMPLEGRHP